MRDPLSACEAHMQGKAYKCLPAALLFYLLCCKLANQSKHRYNLLYFTDSAVSRSGQSAEASYMLLKDSDNH